MFQLQARAEWGPPQRFQWPAEPFRKNLRILNLLKSVWGYICFIELLALDKVYLHKNDEEYLLCVPLLFLFYLFCDQTRRDGPSLTLRWGTWLYNLTCFYGAPAFVVLESTSGAMNSIAPDKYVCLLATRDLLNIALEPNELSIPAIGNCKYCRTSITSFNKNVGYNTKLIRDCKELLEISQQK